MRQQVVIARFEENVAWVNSLPASWEIHVYDKGDGLSNLDPDRVRVSTLGNVGREGDTFLHHIITHYDELADMTLFLQGDPFAHVSNLQLMATLNTENLTTVSAVGLGQWLVCSDRGQPHHWADLPIRELADYLQLPVGGDLSFVAGGQWLIGKDLIRQHPKWFYERLRDKICQDSVWGYCLERIWPRIWTPQKQAILYYSHHRPQNPKVPEPIRLAVIEQINAFAPKDSQRIAITPAEGNPLGDVLLTNPDWLWFAHPEAGPHWNLNIYRAIEKGLLAIDPGTLVYMAEHDVLYPADYWKAGQQQYRPGQLGYANNVFFLNGMGYWTYRPSGFQSTVYGERNILLTDVQQRIKKIEFGAGNPAEFDLGKGDDMPCVSFMYSSNWPVLDIRYDRGDGLANTSPTGTHDKGHTFYEKLPYWGAAKTWQKTLGLTDTHGFRVIRRLDWPQADIDDWNLRPDTHQKQ